MISAVDTRFERFRAYFESLIDRLVAAGAATKAQVHGCSDREVHEIEVAQGVRLPLSYRLFLLILGRGAGALLAGTDIYYPAATKLRSWAQELLDECDNPFQLPDDACVFLMHQGYQFHFMLTAAQEEDPQVFHFVEGQVKPYAIGKTFCQFVESTVDQHIRFVKLR